MLYSPSQQMASRPVTIKNILMLVSFFLFGVGTATAYFKFPTLQSADNAEVVAEDIASQDEDPAVFDQQQDNVPYRNSIYGIAFLYPSEAFTDSKDNLYSEYGAVLGTEIPYQQITMALDGNVTVSIWDRAKLAELRQGMPSSTVLATIGFTQTELQKMNVEHTDYLVMSGEYVIHIGTDPGRKDSSSLIELFVKSFRLMNVTQLPVTEFWPEHTSEHFSFKYPHDWSVQDNGKAPGIFRLTQFEESQKDYGRGGGIFPHEVYRLLYNSMSLDEWVKSTAVNSSEEFGEAYVKQHATQRIANNTLHTLTICNAEDFYYKGFTISRGERCNKRFAITSPTSEGFILQDGLENQGNIDPYDKHIVGTITFN